MVQFEWNPKEREYEREIASVEATRQDAFSSHPLSHRITVKKRHSVTDSTGKDIQTASTVIENPLDPLTSMSSAQNMTTSGNIVLEEEEGTGGEAEWERRREGILAKYTTTAQIAFAKNFLDHNVSTPIAPKKVERSKMRLAQLEDGESDQPREVGYLTAAEYIARIRELTEDLKRAWKNEERVKTLKLAIQSAKLLGDTSVLSFYPSMFVLVTDLLNTFGQLIFDRLRRKGGNSSAIGGLTDEFDTDAVTEQARETCRNWFFKVASIRELLPRVYIELAILKCYRFISDSEFPNVLNRISATIRGLGHPVVAAYARCYLAQKGYELTFQKEYLMSAYKDTLFTFQKMTDDSFLEAARRQGISTQQYWTLYAPALDYVVHCIARHPTKGGFQDLVQAFHRSKLHSGVVLNAILCSYPPEFVSPHALALIVVIKQMDESSFSQAYLLSSLGKCLVKHPPVEEQRLVVLNDVWKVVTKSENIQDYLGAAVVYVEYILKYLSDRDVNAILNDVMKHVKPLHGVHVSSDEKTKARAEETQRLLSDCVYPSLYAIITKILNNMNDFARAVSLDKFMSLLELFDKRWKYDACKFLLEQFSKCEDNIVSDPVLIYSVFNIAKYLHDSLDYLSFEDERKQVGKLIISFIRKVHFGRDLEQWLSFLVDCRRVFIQLDPVKAFMVMSVCELSMRTRAIVKGRHTKKTAAFVKGCMAYCHISIPSIEDPFTRLHANLLCGQVALANQCLTQGDTFFKAAITLVQDLPEALGSDVTLRSVEDDLVSFLSSFAAALVVTPGHPEHGACYLVKGLLTVVNAFPWDASSDGKIRVLFALLRLFSAYAQKKLPYHIDSLESNDTMFAGDAAYREEVVATSNGILEEILNELARIGETTNPVLKRRQGPLALDVFNILLAFGSLEGKGVKLAANLFGLAKKGGATSSYLRNSYNVVELRSVSGGPRAYTYGELLQKISL